MADLLFSGESYCGPAGSSYSNQCADVSPTTDCKKNPQRIQGQGFFLLSDY